MRELRWHGVSTVVTPRRVWDRLKDGAFMFRWPVFLIVALGPLVIGGPLGLTPDLVEFMDEGQTVWDLNSRYDGLLVGYLVSLVLLVGLAGLLWAVWRIWSDPRPYGVRPNYRPAAAGAALWIALATGAMFLPIGPKSERTVIIPPPAAQTESAAR